MKKVSEKKTAIKAPKKTVRSKTGGDGQGPAVLAGIKKQYLKARPACKVTFTLPREAAANARTVHIVGDFNGWDTGATPMQRRKTGDFSVTVELETGREYRYRYLVDGSWWENDWKADRYEPNPYGGDDSVVVV